jgi:hypothetical protein
MSTDRHLAEGTGTDPEACRLQSRSRRCPSPMGLPSVFGGERRSRSSAACATELLSREPRSLIGSLSKTLDLAESGGLDPQPLARSHRFRGGPGPCPVHSPENDRGRGTRNPIAHAIDLRSKQSRARPDSPLSVQCGAPGRFRSGCLLPDKQALSRLSYGGMNGGSGRPNRTAVGDGI